MLIKSVGLPRMHKEKSEKRDFLPQFLKDLNKYSVKVVLEEGYGTGLGISPDEYIRANLAATFGTIEEAYNQDLVIVLKAPENHRIDLMKNRSVLMSMLHYQTRPTRIQKLKEKNIRSI